MLLTGIYRSRTFSPNQHGKNDQLILEATARVLMRLGCTVRFMDEDDVGVSAITTDTVFSMCQGALANDHLARTLTPSRLVINDPRAVKRCYRQNLYRRPLEGGEMLPQTTLVHTSDASDLTLLWGNAEAMWVKRGDVHSTQDGDVVKVHSPGRLKEVLDDFRRRNIHTAAGQRHVTGTVVKFYGVVGSTFFRFYAEHDHKEAPMAFHHARPQVEALVRRMGLEVYGGDAVISPDGQVSVIDVNDWPSFAYFRDEAAEAIGRRVFSLALSHSRQQVAAEGRKRVVR